MNLERDDFFVSTDPELLDIDFICSGLGRTHWARHRSRAVIEESIRNSVCFGIYGKGDNKQAGFARVVTDRATFSWLCDLFIDETHRTPELEKWFRACIAEDPAVNHSVKPRATKPRGIDPAPKRVEKAPATVTLTDAEREFLTS